MTVRILVSILAITFLQRIVFFNPEPAYAEELMLIESTVSEVIEPLYPIYGTGDTSKVGVIIKTNGTFYELLNYGIELQSIIGDFASATIYLNDLVSIRNMASVIGVELCAKMYPMLNQSVPSIKDDFVHDILEYTGKGIFLAILKYFLY